MSGFWFEVPDEVPCVLCGEGTLIIDELLNYDHNGWLIINRMTFDIPECARVFMMPCILEDGVHG